MRSRRPDWVKHGRFRARWLVPPVRLWCRVCKRPMLHEYLGPQEGEGGHILFHLWGCLRCHDTRKGPPPKAGDDLRDPESHQPLLSRSSQVISPLVCARCGDIFPHYLDEDCPGSPCWVCGRCGYPKGGPLPPIDTIAEAWYPNHRPREVAQPLGSRGLRRTTSRPRLSGDSERERPTGHSLRAVLTATVDQTAAIIIIAGSIYNVK